MGILDETRSIERLRFFDGQRLFASDLQAIEAFNREMRWLHNQSLHQPGIGKGFAVTGRKGDREVRIGPGYALDDQGREIVLTSERVEPVPPVDSEPDGDSVFFDLTVSYPDGSTLAEAETRQGICLKRGAVRLREEPVFCWVRLVLGDDDSLTPVDTLLGRAIEKSSKIVLARVEVLQCKLKQPVSLAERKSARPATQPYIACGHGTVDWQPWPPPSDPGRPVLLGKEAELKNLAEIEKMAELAKIAEAKAEAQSLEYHYTGHVDTSAAGFGTVPCYTARIEGERVLNVDGQAFLADLRLFVTASSQDSFDVHLWVVLNPVSVPPPMGLKWPSIWRVVWMGVE